LSLRGDFPKDKKRLSLGYIAAAALAFGSATSADALVINLTDMGGVTGSQYETSFKAAKRFWETVLTDDVTVDFKIGIAEGGGGNVLGVALTPQVAKTQAQWRAALVADVTTPLDAIATANLANFSNPNVALAPALQKALGVYTGPDFIGALVLGGADPFMSFNCGYGWDVDTRNGIQGISFDFLGVVIHEMGHSLGFSSGVTEGGTLDSQPANTDMFRYKNGAWDVTWGGAPYFSIDGGANPLFGNSYFSTGDDGRQPSHWRDADRIRGTATTCGQELEPSICIMEPTGNSCQIMTATANDLAVFDAIGWNLNMDILSTPRWTISTPQIMRDYLASVPEPSTWAMMIFGFGAIGGAMRRRPRVAVRFS